MATTLTSENQSDSSLIFEAITGQIDQLNTLGPATVLSYDHETQLAQIELDIKEVLIGGEVVKVAPINNARLCFNKTRTHRLGNGYIAEYWPVFEGTRVLAFHSKMPLEHWLNGDYDGDPRDTRRHDYTDVFCWIMQGPLDENIPNVDPHDLRFILSDSAFYEELRLGGDTGKIIAYATNGVALGSPTASEHPVTWEGLIKVLNDMILSAPPVFAPGDGGLAAFTAFLTGLQNGGLLPEPFDAPKADGVLIA